MRKIIKWFNIILSIVICTFFLLAVLPELLQAPTRHKIQVICKSKSFVLETVSNDVSKYGKFKVWELSNGALLIEHDMDSIEIHRVKEKKK